VYLAGPYAARDGLLAIALRLESEGFPVTSSWLRETHEPDPAAVGTAPQTHHEARPDTSAGTISDVILSDVFLAVTVSYCAGQGWITPDQSNDDGSRHFEHGFAKGCGKATVLLGAPENAFQQVMKRRADSVEGALTWLAAIPAPPTLAHTR
jgi:hypothetical protein